MKFLITVILKNTQAWLRLYLLTWIPYYLCGVYGVRDINMVRQKIIFIEGIRCAIFLNNIFL